MKHALMALAGALALAMASGVQAQSKDTYVGGLLDYEAKPDSKIKDAVDNSLGLDVLFGDRSPFASLPIGYEAHVFYHSGKVKDTFGGGTFKRDGLGLDATYPIPFGMVTPFLLGGVGYQQLKGNGGDTESKTFTELGVGALWGVPDSQNWRLRADLRWMDTFTDPALRDWWVKVGAEYSFGGGAVPAKSEPVHVVEPEKAAEAPAAEPEKAPEPAPEAAPRKVITLKGVQFASGSDQLKPESAAALDEAVKTLTGEYADAKVEVAGHTDNSGNPDYNKQLSKRRAEAVMAYLVEHGVDAGRLTAEGYGSEQPIADNGTKAGRAKNRRVELRVK